MLVLDTAKKKLHVLFRIAQFPMTSSDLEGHSPIASVCKWDYHCAVLITGQDTASRGSSTTAEPIVLVHEA